MCLVAMHARAHYMTLCAHPMRADRQCACDIVCTHQPTLGAMHPDLHAPMHPPRTVPLTTAPASSSCLTTSAPTNPHAPVTTTTLPLSASVIPAVRAEPAERAGTACVWPAERAEGAGCAAAVPAGRGATTCALVLRWQGLAAEYLRGALLVVQGRKRTLGAGLISLRTATIWRQQGAGMSLALHLASQVSGSSKVGYHPQQGSMPCFTTGVSDMVYLTQVYLTQVYLTCI